MLLFFLTIVSSSEVKCPCYPLLYLLDLFLIEYLPWCLSSLEYAIMWSCSLVTSDTILLVFYLVCEVLRNTSNSHGPSRFWMFPMHSTNTVFTWSELPLLPVTLCSKSHNFFLQVILFLIKILLASTSYLVLGIILLL